jgi:hypothetical protein
LYQYVRASTICGAGGGLFTDAPIKKGVYIGRYKGIRVPIDVALHPDYVRGYLMRVGSAMVDGRDPEGRLKVRCGTETCLVDVHGYTESDWRMLSGHGVEWIGQANLMRFINAPTAAHPANLILTSKSGYTGFKTSRDIREGEELIANYGPSYWKPQNDDTCSACLRFGFLLMCDSCNRSYCLECSKFNSKKKIPRGDWFCRVCLERGAG